MVATSDAVWSEQGTTPDAIEAALRQLLGERYAENGGFVPARALNMVAFVDGQYSGEVANRLRGVGRYHASRLVVLSYEPGRIRLDARVSIASEGDPTRGELALLRETVLVQIGDRHLDDLLTIVDPLVVSDLPTLLWSPHGYRQESDQLLELAQAILIDSIDEPDWGEALQRACSLTEQAYVVDLAWLRSTPWRERVAASFEQPWHRQELEQIQQVDIEHHHESTLAAMLFVGWLARSLGWGTAPLQRKGECLSGNASATHGQIELCLRSQPQLQVRGLAGLHLSFHGGRGLRLDRGPGGLHALRRERDGSERQWTILGASRGEGGILGEGIRQALLRDPTYTRALGAARSMVA